MNVMTISVLELLKKMLLFGMYSTGKSLQKMITILMNLLHGTNDVTTRDEENYLLGKSKVEPNTDVNKVYFKKHRR